MAVQKKKKRRVAKAPALDKGVESPPSDTMITNDNKCKRCGRVMLSVRCQCGWVKAINK